MDFEDQAKQYFTAQYNCAQSVIGSFSEQYGLDRETAFRIATPFGGGIGHSGYTCGAVSGAIMVIGLATGTTVYDKEKKDACYALTQLFLKRFTERYGALTCPGLLGVDISDPQVLEQAREQDLFQSVCPKFVGDAAKMVAELLDLAD